MHLEGHLLRKISYRQIYTLFVKNIRMCPLFGPFAPPKKGGGMERHWVYSKQQYENSQRRSGNLSILAKNRFCFSSENGE